MPEAAKRWLRPYDVQALDRLKLDWFDTATDYLERRKRTRAVAEPRSAQRNDLLDLIDAAIDALRQASERPSAVDVRSTQPAPSIKPQLPPDNEVVDLVGSDVITAEVTTQSTRPELSAAPELLLPQELPGYPSEVEVLYEDVIWLFQNADTDGAMVSLERLLVLAPMNENIRAFVRLNEDRLFRLYESVIGPWTQIPTLTPSSAPIPSLQQRHEKFKTILHLVDGQRSLGKIIEESYFLPLETCAVLNQLIRAKIISCGHVEMPALTRSEDL